MKANIPLILIILGLILKACGADIPWLVIFAPFVVVIAVIVVFLIVALVTDATITVTRRRK